MSPNLQTGIRFIAVLGVEWSTLTLLEPSPAWVKIATLALAVAVLGALEFRSWLEKRGRLAFQATLGALIAIYVATGAAAYFWTIPNPESLATIFPWLLAAFGVLGIAIAFYKAIKPHHVPQPSNSASATDGQVHLDLVHLLDFNVNQATVLWLTDLIMKAPINIAAAPLKIDGDTTTAQTSADFVRHVSINLGNGTFRRSDFLNVISMAEAEAERTIEQMPQDQRPHGVDPLVVRRCAIANLQCIRTMEFLSAERREVERKLVAQRSSLLERLRSRSPT